MQPQTHQTKLLRKGSRGQDVRELQSKLHRLGFDLNADGIFGDDTEKAVIQLQSMFGYDVDALVGEGTSRLIDAQLGYGWNVKAPDAAERALRSQGKGSARSAGSKPGFDPMMPPSMKPTSGSMPQKPMSTSSQKPMPQKPMSTSPQKPMPQKPMPQKPMAEPQAPAQKPGAQKPQQDGGGFPKAPWPWRR